MCRKKLLYGHQPDPSNAAPPNARTFCNSLKIKSNSRFDINLSLKNHIPSECHSNASVLLLCSYIVYNRNKIC